MKNSLKFCQETIAKKHSLEIAWIEFAKSLKEIRDGALYKGRWESFEDFLTDPGMAMDKGTASKMITIHEKFIVDFEIEPMKVANAGGWSKVAELLPVIENKKDAEEWLESATSLSKADLRKEVQEKRTGKKGVDHKCTNTYEIVMQCCRDCGSKIVIKGGE